MVVQKPQSVSIITCSSEATSHLVPCFQRQAFGLELELELIQTHMTQKPLLWVEAGAHAVRNKPVVEWGGQAWLSCGACVCVAFEAFLAAWLRQLSLCALGLKSKYFNACHLRHKDL
jgi:hypothetical protein